MTSINRYILMGLFGMWLCSCQDSPTFVGYVHVNHDAWYSEEPVCVVMRNARMQTEDMNNAAQTASVTDKAVLKEEVPLMIGVRRSQAYAYERLALLVELKDDKGDVSCDTVFFDFTDGGGRADGHGVSRQDIVQRAGRLKMCSTNRHYTVRVSHLMRLNPISGITEISFFSGCVQHPSLER